MSQTERLYQIVRLLEDARQPVPLARLLDTLEVSRATFKRDLDYLRDRLGAPIVWRRGGNGEPSGYVLTGERGDAAQRFGIRGLWFNPSEIYALLMMQHLAAGMEPGLVSGQVSGLMTRIGLMLGSAADDPQEVGRRVRILHSASRRATPAAFQTVAQATMKRRRLALRYYARSRGEESERIVSPQQLLHYRENWYLLGWCHHAGALRTFALDAIREARVRRETAREVGPRVLKKAVGGAFGIFDSAPSEHAVLRFAPEVAPWVGNETWHPQQRVEQEAGGGLRLTVPYGDPRELVMEILRFGPDVEVLAPPALREAVAARLRAAAARYETDAAEAQG
ncbi:YafY family transcriptional regulator [Thauera sp. CAU 1555]|uniref:YafY family transcriptional regulator n=1 Tax=Thauera sedimentorum TaxID=2767595 RepID=A0ABR9B6D3_9RHOO|nr:YafY family protein [Thauera sedimentorum]MBC9071013.1 YafY family transcriptional regulator [Thauera sedimentorum]MBD8501932.1 YafY family transcriptional regulator [Thauera sedimentorum]